MPISIQISTCYLQFMASVYIGEKITDCNGVFFIECLMKCENVVKDLAGFGVFGPVGDYMFY